MSPVPQHDLTVVLAGNPNCGKTAIFNALTGARQRVGNWPGVTVERKSGHYTDRNRKINVVDLPGIYSLSAISESNAATDEMASSDKNSIDEWIACEYLLSGEPDCVINIVDASNLERNLYLTLQLLEMSIPVVLVVNMMDVLKRRGITCDLKKLSKVLGCPVVSTVATRGQGIDDLKAAIIDVPEKSKREFKTVMPLPSVIQQSLVTVRQVIESDPQQVSCIDSKWLALRLLEGDGFAMRHVSPAVVTEVGAQSKVIENQTDEEPDILIADARYGFISELSVQVMSLLTTSRETLTQRLDRIVLNRFLGIPFFLLVMYLMFLFAINVAGVFQDFFDIASNAIFVKGVSSVLMQWHTPPWLIAVLAHGVGKGINTMLTFIPVIGGMFLFLSFLEDTGYMARAAFVMDRLMRVLGLPGKSFVPMIVGFGCNVPAVMGARTLANHRDRILTVMMMPFMSCGARLAIFAVFASAFFPVGGQNIIFVLYLVGILVAVLTGLILRKTVLPGQPAPMIMELPPYHLPRLGMLLRHAWQRLEKFLTRAGKVIVPVCMLVGTLNALSLSGHLADQENPQQSILAQVGSIVTPVLAPMGIRQDNWPATVGLVSGVLAKEVVIGTLNSLYSQQAHLVQPQNQGAFNIKRELRTAAASIPANVMALKSALGNPIAASEASYEINRAVYGVMYERFDGKVGAFAYLLFVLLYFPCISTLAAMRREVSPGWAYFSMCWSTGVAYVVAVGCYQLMTILRHPVSSLVWILGLSMVILSVIVGLRRFIKADPAAVSARVGG